MTWLRYDLVSMEQQTITNVHKSADKVPAWPANWIQAVLRLSTKTPLAGTDRSKAFCTYHQQYYSLL